ncbi:MAG: MarR family transcriptional regulator [archaeon]
MIDFACKHFRIEDIVKCSLNLTKGDYAVLHLLSSQEKTLSSQDIAIKLGLDQSTVQRTLKKLHEKKLISRFQENLHGGGYQFTYRADKKLVRMTVKHIIKQWSDTVEKRIEEW